MVKIGFIVEGDTESIIVNSPAFISFLRAKNFELVTPVIDAKGGGNLLPKYVDNFVVRLRNAGAQQICILTDLEDAASTADVQEALPEATMEMPWDGLKEISRELGKQGPGSSKTAFAKRIVTYHGFDIQSSASHPACPSAHELVDWFENQ